jgi:hypothetical protein
MQTYTIPEDQWMEFFDAFSRDHVGWRVSIEVLDREAGPEHVAEDLPLQGISFDTKGTRPSAIQISAGDFPDAHVRHVVDLPLHIRRAEEPSGDVDVQIEPATGPVTLLHLRNPVH